MSNISCIGANRIVLGIAIILLMVLFPTYAVLFSPNQNVAQAANPPQPIKPPGFPKPAATLSQAGWRQFMTGHLTMFSTAVMLTLARDFGVRQVTGKAVNQPSTHNGKNVKPALPNGLNIPVVGSSGDDFEDTSIAFDPTNEQYGYAVTIFDASGGETFSNLIVGEACLVFQTVTGGTTWTFFGFCR